MVGGVLLASSMVAGALLLGWPASGGGLARVAVEGGRDPWGGRSAAGPAGAGRRGHGSGRRGSLQQKLAVAAGGGVAAFVLVGGPPGAVVGGIVAAALAVRRPRGEVPPTRAERAALAQALPVAAVLLGDALAAGATPVGAVVSLAQCAPPALATWLEPVAGELALGAPAHRAWRTWLVEPLLAPVARTLVRTSESGASAAPALRQYAADLARDRRASAAAEAAVVGVKATVPLALCFLPAFVLLAVVPAVWGLVVPLLGA
jgi:Flp pilus assembly protein TadB